MSETRAERRQRILDEGAERGREHARQLHMTITCARTDRSRHDTCVGGDRCICDCHDDDTSG